MRKISLSTFVIFVPLIIAVACAIYSARVASVRKQAMIVFDKSMDNQLNTKYSTGINELVTAYGWEKAAAIVESKAKASNLIAFDGVSRVAKVVARTKEWKGQDLSQSDYSDGVVLQDFGHAGAAVWDGPMGTRVSGIRFVDGKLTISIYGTLQLGASTRIVPQEQPEHYVVPWPQGSKPNAGSLYNQVVARNRRGG